MMSQHETLVDLGMTDIDPDMEDEVRESVAENEVGCSILSPELFHKYPRLASGLSRKARAYMRDVVRPNKP